jgi:tetratricopeptide (TPR) repeat protein
MFVRRFGVGSLLLAICLIADRPDARGVSVIDLLDRYSGGQFDDVTEELAGDIDFGDLLKQLKRDAPVWFDAGGPADRSRRELVAATFALEAARADEWREWKWIQKQPQMCPPDPPPGAEPSKAGCYQPLNVLYWKPPPLLIEWACELFRKDEVPRPIERWWQLAAIAVAQRSEDSAFLVGDPAIGRGAGAGEIINTQEEIKHLDHVQKRFPAEMRFMLAQGIARDPMWRDDATQAYTALMNDADTGGEAAMRMGAMLARTGAQAQAAFAMFDRAETQTRDPYVIYLARYFRAQLLEGQNKLDDAQAAYRGAAAAWPNGQAATTALAASLFRDGKRAEAYELADAMLDAPDPLFDPWREYVHADDRFWPLLIGKLRAGIVRGNAR